VYLGVTRVFNTLQQYWVNYDHVLYGVGGKQTKIVAMLKDVPIRMGCNTTPASDLLSPNSTTAVDLRATFLVVDNDDYHWILGIPLLAELNGMVHCRDRTLQYTSPGADSPATLTSSLVPTPGHSQYVRSSAFNRPIWKLKRWKLRAGREPSYKPKKSNM
jgi:hypothetical protein